MLRLLLPPNLASAASRDAIAVRIEVDLAAEPPPAALADVPEWPEGEKLKYEKEALDFYFSSHPLAEHEDRLRRFCTHTVDQLFDLGPNQEAVLGGMLVGVRFANTKVARNGNSKYLRCKLEDLTGAIECVMWPDDLARCREEVREEQPYFVRGVVERTREQPSLIELRDRRPPGQHVVVDRANLVQDP